MLRDPVALDRGREGWRHRVRVRKPPPLPGKKITNGEVEPAILISEQHPERFLEAW